MDNRYDMQYFSSAAILELLKKIAKLKMYAKNVSTLAKDNDSIFTQDLIEELIKHVGLVEDLALRGNEMIYEEKDGWLALINALPEGRANQHLMFWDELAVQEKVSKAAEEGRKEGIGIAEALSDPVKEAKDLIKQLKEATDRIEVLEDELHQLRK